MPKVTILGSTFNIDDNATPEQLQKVLPQLVEVAKQRKAGEVYSELTPIGGTTKALLEGPAQELANVPEGDWAGLLTAAGNYAGRIPAAVMAELPKLGAAAMSKLRSLFGDASPEPSQDTLKKITAAEVGLAGGATNLERGIVQLLPDDYQSENINDFNDIQTAAKADKDVGGIAKGAELVGIFLDPMGLAIGHLNLASKVANPVLRTAANTAIQGGVWGGLGYQEEPGHRLENAALGAAVGGAGGALLGKLADKVAVKKIQQAAQREVIRRVLIGEKPQEALQSVIKKYPTRALKQGKFKLRVPANPERAVKLADDLYVDTSKLPSWTRAPKNSIRQSLARTLIPYETHLRDFSPELYKAHRRSLALGKLFEADLWKSHEKLDRWLYTTAKKLPKAQRAELKEAFVNQTVGDFAKKYKLPELEKAWNESRKAFDQEYKILKTLGNDYKYVENYFPRALKDRKGFLKEAQKLIAKRDGVDLRQVVADQEAKLGRELTDSEITGIVMKHWYKNTKLPEAKFQKERVFDIVPKPFVKFYDEPRAALHSHLKEAAENYTDRLFLNQLDPAFKEGSGSLRPDIIAKTLQAVAKDKSPAEVSMMAEKMASYYANRGRGMSPKLRAIKNAVYALTLGNPRSSLTQIKDIGFSLHRFGIQNTAKQILPFVRKAGIDIGDDLALHDLIAEEFSHAAAGRKALDKVLAMAGFTKLDRLGKRVAVNASVESWAKLAKKAPEQFVGKWKWYFGKDTTKVLNDLRNWHPGKPATPEMLEIALNDLLDIQPLGMAQMPLGYIENPNARIFYTLNSFTIKQADYIRNRIWKQFQAGNKKAAIKDLIRYLIAMASIGVPVEMVKDFIVFKEDTPTFADRVTHELLNALVLGARFQATNPLSVFNPSERIPNIEQILFGPLKDATEVGPTALLGYVPFLAPWVREWVKEAKKENKELEGSTDDNLDKGL